MPLSRLSIGCCVLVVMASASANAEVVLGPADLDRITAGQHEQCPNCELPPPQCTICEPPSLPSELTRFQIRLEVLSERVAQRLAAFIRPPTFR